MTSYIYLASDKSLPTGELADRVVPIGETEYHITFDSFFFEEIEGGESVSRHFSKTDFQVCAMDIALPTSEEKSHSPRASKALKELYGYIENQLVNRGANELAILFCLNGNENQGLFKTVELPFKELELKDLYYEELKLMKIMKSK